MTIESIHNMAQNDYFISSVSDHGIKLKLSNRESINVYFGNFQWLPWQRQSKLVKKQKELSQANTPVDISMVIKKLPSSWSIHAILFVLGLNTNDNNANAVSIHNMAWSYFDFSTPTSERELLIIFRLPMKINILNTLFWILYNLNTLMALCPGTT